MTDLDPIRKYKRVLVTGPQRSGTTICARIIEAEFGHRYVDERKVGVRSLCKLVLALRESNVVVQGPCFSPCCHWIDTPETAVVFMIRDVGDIKASQQRIGWGWADYERQNYFRDAGEIADIRYEAWDRYQKPMMQVPYFEVRYQDLSVHPLWVDKESREKFTHHRQYKL